MESTLGSTDGDPEYLFRVDGVPRGQARFSAIAEALSSGALQGSLEFSGDGLEWEPAEVYDGVLTMPFVRPVMPRPRSLAKREFKVLSQKDRWFSGKFDPELLEAALNDHARLGWDVLTVTTASREGLLAGAGKDELIVIFYRDLPQPLSVGSNQPIHSVSSSAGISG